MGAAPLAMACQLDLLDQRLQLYQLRAIVYRPALATVGVKVIAEGPRPAGRQG
jgi:hypothetical protein